MSVTREAAAELLVSHGAEVDTPQEIVDAVVERLRPSVRLAAAPSADAHVVSRIGGTPDVGDGFEWPRSSRGIPLAFLMQIDLAEVRSVDVENELPTSGVLQAFFEWDPTVPPLEEEWRLQRLDPSSLATRAEFPGDLVEDCRFESFPLKPVPEWTLPNPDEIGMDNFYAGNLDLLTFWDEADSRLEELHGFGPHWTPKHRMLGWPNFIQTPGMADDAKLLLQIDSDPPRPCEWPTRSGMMWGDCGMIYWIADEETLRSGDYASVRPFWECC